MRVIAAGLGLVIIALSPSFAADAPTAAHTPPASRATAKPVAAASAPPPSSAASDAVAARHAKRIACRKEAAEQKLTGDDKVDYIKDCIKKPPAAKH